MISDFKEWLDELRSNKLWYYRIKEMYPRKNLMAIAQQVHTWLIAKEDNRDMPSTRALFQRFANDAPDGTIILNTNVEEPVKDNWKPVTWEERSKWLEKWQEVHDKSPLVQQQWRSRMQINAEEEGQERPKATAFHRSEIDTRIGAIENVKHLREARKKTFLTAFPDASEDEIHAYIMQFDHIDNPDKII